jgi:hypothetical protein
MAHQVGHDAIVVEQSVIDVEEKYDLFGGHALTRFGLKSRDSAPMRLSVEAARQTIARDCPSMRRELLRGCRPRRFIAKFRPSEWPAGAAEDHCLSTKLEGLRRNAGAQGTRQ